MTDNIREKTRAVFFAAIMVTSMVAAVASFGGAAAATNHAEVDPGEITVDDFNIGNEEVAILSEEVRYTNNFSDGFNVGPVLGIPVQDPFFDDETSPPPENIDFSDDGEFTESNLVNYSVQSFQLTANNTNQDQEVIINFEDADNAGLDLNEEVATLSHQNGTTRTLENWSFVDVNNDVAEVAIEVKSDSTENRLFEWGSDSTSGFGDLVLSFEAEDQVEGLNIPNALAAIEIEAEGTNNEDSSDTVLAYDEAVTGISQVDAKMFDGREDINASINASIDGETAAYGQFVGSQILVQANNAGNTIEVYEAARNDSDDNNNYVLGDEVTSVNTDTDPSNTTAIDTSNLDAGEYFIGFNENDNIQQHKFVFLDLRDLNLEASANNVPIGEEVEIQVNSTEDDAIRDTGDVQVWVREAGDDDLEDVIEVQRERLLGVTGNTEFDINASTQLDGEGLYEAIVLHEDSGITTTTTFNVTEAQQERVLIDSPQVGDDPYNRGDIFQVDLTFQNTETGTITIGDRDEGGQNFEVNITVRDDGDGSGSFYVNTFQLGDGPGGYADESDLDGHANHGIRSIDDSLSIVDIEGNRDMEIAGGSASDDLIDATNENRSRVVIAEGPYDLRAAVGDTPASDSDVATSDETRFRLEPRQTGNLSLWESPSPGDRSTIVDAETVAAIRTGIDEGYVTRQEGAMADNDVLVATLEASGLEGYLLNALEEEDLSTPQESVHPVDQDVIEDFLDHSDDDVVTEAFDAADNIYADSDGVSFDTNQSESDLDDLEDERNVRDLDGAFLDLEQEDVLGEINERGTLTDYFITIDVTDENINDPDGTAEELPVEWNTTFTFDTEISDEDAGDYPNNAGFAEANVQFAEWDLVPDEVTVDNVEDGLLTVPAANTTIAGDTEIAAGTELYATITPKNVDSPLFNDTRNNEAPLVVEHVAGGPNRVAFNENFNNFAGAEFTLDMRRLFGVGDSLIDPDLRSGTGLDGQVRETAIASAHSFSDQTTGGSVVVIDEVDVNQPGEIQIEDANGTVLGTRAITEGTTQNIRILLDEELTESQDLTSVLLDETGTEFDANASSAPVRQTATITIGQGQNAFLDVRNLDPVAVTAEPGQSLTVSAEIVNSGGAAVNQQDVEFRLDGETVDTTTVTLEADGDSQTVEFEVTAPESDGEYVHSIASQDDEAEGQLTVATPEPSDDSMDDSMDDGNGTDGTTDDSADDGGAGFGVAAAVIALLGAALLAYRRRDE